MNETSPPPPSEVVAPAPTNETGTGHGDDVSMMTQDSPSVIGLVTSSIGSAVYFPFGYLMRSKNTEEETGKRKLGSTDNDIDITLAEVQEDKELKEHTDAVPAKNCTIDFLQDSRNQMTWGRRIGLYLMHRKWYNPHAENIKAIRSESETRSLLQEARPPKRTREELPSLEKAWAYFEHFALPRHLLDEKARESGELSRAEPGEAEHPTKLYDPICTPLSQMGDFGLGIGLYFSTLRAITVLTFLCGLLNIPNFMFFSGPIYSNGQPGVKNLLKGSAICTNEVWVPCVDCSVHNFTFSKQRFGTVITTNGDTLNFAIHNDCDGATLEQGMINYGTLLLVLFGIMVINAYQKKKEVEFDEDEQTAQDCKWLDHFVLTLYSDYFMIAHSSEMDFRRFDQDSKPST